jgi:hypothetical protein
MGLVSLGIRTYVKIEMKYHFISKRIAKPKTTDNSTYWQVCEVSKILFLAVSIKLTFHSCCATALPFLGNFSREMRAYVSIKHQ